MAKLFHELRERLLRAGVAPRHVRRYVGELQEHFADLIAEEERAGRNRAEAQSAALARIGSVDELAKAMIKQRQFQSWSARAPWVVFGLGWLPVMSAAYLVAGVYLWCGWKMFIPGADTPFGQNPGNIYGLSNIYFQAGKFYYELLPILVAWSAVVIAIRQRTRLLWPAIASALIAWMGATAQIEASRTLVPGSAHIDMQFFLLGPADSLRMFRLMYGVAIFAIGLVPFFLWRIQRRFSDPPQSA